MRQLKLTDQYNPLLFLAALGAGGLTVSFFMYPMFLIKHADTPMVTFNHLWPLLTGDNWLLAGLLALDLLALLFFAFSYFRLLAWNVLAFWQFRQTPAFYALKIRTKKSA